jgi:hypothetical protein
METAGLNIMPLYFAAPISWYVEAFGKQVIVLKNDARFPKQTYRHKLDYVSVEGIQMFSIPLVRHTRQLDYRSVEISYHEHWQNQLINALKTSYGKSPFFEYYDYRFEEVISEKWQFLWDLNYRMLEVTLQCLKLDIQLSVLNAEAYMPDPVFVTPERPYYQVFADKIGFKKEMTILDLIFNEGSNAWNILRGHQPNPE